MGSKGLQTTGSTRSYGGAVLAGRFRLGSAPTLLTRAASVTPIGFTHLRSEGEYIRARDVPYEDTYSFHVTLLPATFDLWIDGRHELAAHAELGDTFLIDLRVNPVPEFHTAFDFLRFYISQ